MSMFCLFSIPQVNLSRLLAYGDAGSATIFYLCLALVVIILADAFWVGYQFSQNRIRFIFTVKFLRSVSDLVIGPLYIPVS